MKLLICYGTRPEYIKIKPLLKVLKNKINYKILFVKQHTNIMAFAQYDYQLVIENETKNRLNNIFYSIYKNFNIPKGITHILIQGDTATAYGLALAAFNANIKIIHLEAGLRTYDLNNPYPEEAYRQMISRISDINLCPTENNKNNLIKERVKGLNFVVGNTVLDNLIKIKPTYSNKILITLHRRENHNILNKYFIELSKLASENKDLEFILPIHPNPNVKKYQHLLKNIKVIEPLEYENLLKILADIRFAISDSGGIQEECSFLNKKVIVCRKVTERQESLKKHSFICKDPKQLKEIFNKIKKKYKVNQPCPFGDGKASEKILDILLKINDNY